MEGNSSHIYIKHQKDKPTLVSNPTKRRKIGFQKLVKTTTNRNQNRMFRNINRNDSVQTYTFNPFRYTSSSAKAEATSDSGAGLPPLSVKDIEKISKKKTVELMNLRGMDTTGTHKQLFHRVMKENATRLNYDENEMMWGQHSVGTTDCNHGKKPLKEAGEVEGICRLNYIIPTPTGYTYVRCTNESDRLAHMHTADHIFCYVASCCGCNNNFGQTQAFMVGDAHFYPDLHYIKPDHPCDDDYLFRQKETLQELAQQKNHNKLRFIAQSFICVIFICFSV